MKILQVHNKYKVRGGECNTFENTADLLTRKGNSVSVLVRDSRDIGDSVTKKISALVSGIYSLSGAREMTRIIHKEHPDVVHVHNIYPLLSPSVLVACHEAGVPVVMTCHNYRLVCPIAFHLHNDAVCERCCGGREYWCVLNNCRNNMLESVGYALRNIIARRRRHFLDNVLWYAAPTEFVKQRLIDAGFPKDRITVLRNPVLLPDTGVDASKGKYAAYAGRISTEKGIGPLLAAIGHTGLPLHLAGDYSEMPEVTETGSSHVKFLNVLDRKKLYEFYRNARFLVVPSIWFEVFSIVVAEAMAHGLPVIASNIGGLPELVEDGVTGLLAEPGNSEGLAEKIRYLWERPELCRKMGGAGREKALREFSEDVYYERLMGFYQKAIEINKGQRS